MKMKRSTVLLFTLAVLVIAACTPKGQPQNKRVKAKDFPGLLFSFYVSEPKGGRILVEKVPKRLAARITRASGETFVLPCKRTGEVMSYSGHGYYLNIRLNSAILSTPNCKNYINEEIPIVNYATNALGERLEMEFGMLDNRARMVWHGDTILLCQDIGQASGIRYLGGAYEFTSWHGITELRKGGNLIFAEHKKEE
jgi:hypothetical protein